MFREWCVSARLFSSFADLAVNLYLGPYFYYNAVAPEDISKPTDKKWPNLPECLNQAKEIVLHRTRMYGEVKDEQISIKLFTVTRLGDCWH